MDAYEKDEVPMLSETCEQSLHDPEDFQHQRETLSTSNASWSLPMGSVPSYERRNIAGFTGPLTTQKPASFIQMSGPLYIRSSSQDLYPTQGTVSSLKESSKDTLPAFNVIKDSVWSRDNYGERNDHLLKSGQLGMCHDPYCTSCPSDYRYKAAGIKHKRFDRFDVKDGMCIVMSWTAAIVIVVFRSITDFIYFLHIVLQFRLAFVAPETTVVGAGDLVDHPKKIAIHYLTGYFFVDLFSVLPLPQIIVLFVLPYHLSSSGANYAKNLIRAAVLVQYLPRLYRFFPLLAGRSSIGFIFESAWANFVINLLTFVLVGHIVGSFWYLFGLQRVNQCLRDVCNRTKQCMFMDCGYGQDSFNHSSTEWITWNGVAKNSCLITSDIGDNNFKYGIYQQVVFLTTEPNTVKRYVYSLFWGFQQISTLAGNLVPSFFVWEVFFTMAIIGLGLLLFALLIGNMQNFLQSLGRRKLEMSLRRRDVEQWMSHRRLPDELKRRVRDAERYNWAATRGVNEETMMENLAEDLQREIRHHLFRFLDKVRIFAMMEEPILDSIRERLRQKTYIKGSCILYPGGLIEKMIFIVRGQMESIGEDGVACILAENNICGEELLIWYLDNSAANRDVKKNRFYGERPYSTKSITCSTNVEAFILRAEDLEQVTKRFSRFLRNPRVQRAIRYETPYWRSFAATRIQVAWRYRKKRLSREKSTSQSQ